MRHSCPKRDRGSRQGSAHRSFVIRTLLERLYALTLLNHSIS
jgi:hypothetical protein